MSDLSFLALPNIAGMRLWRYIQIFGIVLLFWACLFFLIFFRIRYRRGKQLFRQLHVFDQRAKELEQELVLQKIRKSSGKELAILFIDYLERFVTNKAYANLTELLEPQWFTASEAEEIEKTIYTDMPLPKILENKLHHYFTR